MCSVEKKFWKLYQNSQQSTLKLNQLKKESITTIFLEIYWIFQNSCSTKSLWTVASSFQCLPNLFTKFMIQYTVSLQSSVTMSLPDLPSQTARVNFLILSNFLSLERNTRVELIVSNFTANLAKNYSYKDQILFCVLWDVKNGKNSLL